MPTNPHERFHRSKKVTAMADLLWSLWTDGDRRNPDSVEMVRAASPAWRDAVAERAGIRTPSNATWEALCERLATLIEAERAHREVRVSVPLLAALRLRDRAPKQARELAADIRQRLSSVETKALEHLDPSVRMAFRVGYMESLLKGIADGLEGPR